MAAASNVRALGWASSSRPFWLLAAFCGVALALALVSQHRFDMQPCPWCVLQRLIYLVIAVLAIAGALVRSVSLRKMLALLASGVACSGIASALWQHFVSAASQSCNLTLADRIIAGLGLDEQFPEVFMARASCADAAVSVLGVPYAFWSLAGFVVCIALALWAAPRRTV